MSVSCVHLDFSSPFVIMIIFEDIKLNDLSSYVYFLLAFQFLPQFLVFLSKYYLFRSQIK